jgi:hypothetical protein
MVNIAEALKSDSEFFSDIATLLQTARSNTYRTVNSIMIETCWQIGCRIVEQEQHGKERADYGNNLIANLSRYLTDIFGKSLSEGNLWNFRKFYLVCPDLENFTHCVKNLNWTNIRLIVHLDNEAERNWYFKEAAEQNWSSRILERN